jgi:hypothetical protein
MFFLIDSNLKIIFGWSAKCGCSHIKKIFWYLSTGDINHKIHIKTEYNELPIDIENYTTIIICRNPYNRIISGFLDKYKTNGEFREMWKNNTIKFRDFVSEIVKENWSKIQRHHFIPQTSEKFNEDKIMKSKIIKFYDITKIDYNYIENLYNKKIPDEVIYHKQGHERGIKEFDYNDYVYDLDMSTYYDYNVDIKYFYDDELKEKVHEFYKNDFIFFAKNGIKYEL